MKWHLSAGLGINQFSLEQENEERDSSEKEICNKWNGIVILSETHKGSEKIFGRYWTDLMKHFGRYGEPKEMKSRKTQGSLGKTKGSRRETWS